LVFGGAAIAAAIGVVVASVGATVATIRPPATSVVLVFFIGLLLRRSNTKTPIFSFSKQ
jgi:hypothetical protein